MTEASPSSLGYATALKGAQQLVGIERPTKARFYPKAASAVQI